ncbi:hypothetical protein JCM11641_005525 [Rhodosporidiobolus odoratus]
MTSPLPPLAQATSGALGGVISNAIVFPLDTLTSRLQTSSRSARSRSAQSSSGSSKNSKQGGYSSLSTAIRTIVSREGWQAFYAGLGPDSLSTLVSQFVYFFLYSALRDRLQARKLRRGVGVKVAASPVNAGGKGKPPAPPLLSALEELAVGCLVGVVAKGVVSPLSMITVRAQTSSEPKQDAVGGTKGDKAPVDAGALSRHEADKDDISSHDSSDTDSDEGGYAAAPSALRIGREIYAEQGLRGFWSGFQSTILLTLNPAITYYVFALIHRAVIPAKHRSHPTPAQTFFSGALASAVASAIVFPLILAKTRLQFRSPTGKALYSSQFDVFRKTMSKYGWRGLYAGIEAQLLKGFFSNGLQLLLKDRIELVIVVLHRILSRRSPRTVEA